MSANRLRLILSFVFILVMLGLLLWGRAQQHATERQQTLEQMHRDVAAARAAADSAARSAAEARDAANRAWNALPGSS